MLVNRTESQEYRANLERNAASQSAAVLQQTVTDLVNAGVDPKTAQTCAKIRVEGNHVAEALDGALQNDQRLQEWDDLHKTLSFEIVVDLRTAEAFFQERDPEKQSQAVLEMTEQGLAKLQAEEARQYFYRKMESLQRRVKKRKAKKAAKKHGKKAAGQKKRARTSPQVQPSQETRENTSKHRNEPTVLSACVTSVDSEKSLCTVKIREKKPIAGADDTKAPVKEVEVTVSAQALHDVLIDPQSHYNMLAERIKDESDWRKLSPSARNERRYQVAVAIVTNSQLPEEEQQTQKEIAARFQVSENTVSSLVREISEMTEISSDAFKEEKKGRKPSNPTKIPACAFESLKEALRRRPFDYGYEYTSWTGPCIHQFINDQFEVDVSMRYVYYYLDKMGFRLKFAQKLHHKFDPEAAKEFKKQLSEKLRYYASRGYTIVFEDETHLQQGNSVRGYAFGGEEAIADHSTNTLRTEYTYVVYMGVKMIKISEFKGTLEAKDFIITLKNLMFNNKNKYLVILDNAPIHTADEVTKWIDSKENNNRIALLYLPKYAPKMNPVEYFNNELKAELRKKVSRSVKKLVERAREFVRRFVDKNGKTLLSATSKIKSYFRCKHCKYFIETYSKLIQEFRNTFSVSRKEIKEKFGVCYKDALEMIKKMTIASEKSLSENVKNGLSTSLLFLQNIKNCLGNLFYNNI